MVLSPHSFILPLRENIIVIHSFEESCERTQCNCNNMRVARSLDNTDTLLNRFLIPRLVYARNYVAPQMIQISWCRFVLISLFLEACCWFRFRSIIVISSCLSYLSSFISSSSLHILRRRSSRRLNYENVCVWSSSKLMRCSDDFRCLFDGFVLVFVV